MVFNFLRKKREYLSCGWLEYGIHFASDGLFYCDKYAHRGSSIKPVSVLNDDNTYNFKDFYSKKAKDIKLVRKGCILDRCQGCYLMEKRVWESSKKIKYMAISTNTSCNSNCIYCYTHRFKKLYNKKPDIPVFEFIKNAINNKLIDPDCEVQIGGGEPVLNKEFDDILNLMADNNFDNIRIYSSGIEYNRAIERALKNDLLQELIISPDAGNSDLYKRIKCVDKFNEVWTNIKSYAEAQNQKKDRVRIKYIIVPSVNDKEEYIKEFVDKAKECGIRHVIIDIEMTWYKDNYKDKKKIEDIFRLIKYTKMYASEKNIKCTYNSSVCCAVEDYPVLNDSDDKV